MAKKSDRDSYDVGYKKPPSATRFPAGTSGNPRGRPKKSGPVGLADNDFEAMMNEICGTAVINGKKVSLTGREAIIRSLVATKGKSSVKAIATLLKWERDLVLRAAGRRHLKGNDSATRGGFLLVPAIMPVNEWEAIARPMQAALLASVRD